MTNSHAFQNFWQPTYVEKYFQGSVSYEITVVRGDAILKQLESSKASIRITDLAPGTEHQFQVVAVGREKRRSEPSEPHRDATGTDQVYEMWEVQLRFTQIALFLAYCYCVGSGIFVLLDRPSVGSVPFWRLLFGAGHLASSCFGAELFCC